MSEGIWWGRVGQKQHAWGLMGRQCPDGAQIRGSTLAGTRAKTVGQVHELHSYTDGGTD